MKLLLIFCTVLVAFGVFPDGLSAVWHARRLLNGRGRSPVPLAGLIAYVLTLLFLPSAWFLRGPQWIADLVGAIAFHVAAQWVVPDLVVRWINRGREDSL